LPTALLRLLLPRERERARLVLRVTKIVVLMPELAVVVMLV
jgi:hypothetical protein